MRRAHFVLDRIRGVGRLLGCTVRTYFADGVGSEGAALAFYSAFSLAPLLVILVAVLGWLIGTERADLYVHEQLRLLVGSESADAIFAAAFKAREAQSEKQLVAGIVSLGVMLLGATTVFAEIQSALDRMWRAPDRKVSGVLGWLLTRVWSLGLVLTIGFLLLVSLTVATVLAALSELWAPVLVGMATLTAALDMTISLALHSLLFALVYRYLPAVRLPWRIVLIGAATTAIMFYLGRIAIGFYLARAAATSLYGAAASFAVLLLWLYYSAQIFLFGAQLTVCLSQREPRKQGERTRRRTRSGSRGAIKHPAEAAS